MSEDLYQEIIIEESKHPQNQGTLPDATLTLKGGNASCGDLVTIYLKIVDEKVVDLKWVGSGCAISQASMSLLSQKILSENISLKQLQQMTKKEMLSLLGLTQISPAREKCLMVGLKTIQSGEK